MIGEMKKLYIKHISGILAVNEWQGEHCVQLLEEGATVQERAYRAVG